MPDKKELLEMFKLDDTPTVVEDHGDFWTETALPKKQKPPTELSPYCLKLDEWDIAKGRELTEKAGAGLRAMLDPCAVESLADFHGLAYLQKPKLLDMDDVFYVDRLKFIEGLKDSPEFKSLRKTTKGNEAASEIAAFEFASQYAKSREQQKEEGDNELQGMVSAAAAVAKAKEKLDSMDEIAKAMGGGDPFNSKANAEQIADLYNRIRNNPRLRKIFDNAGRFRLAARSKQTTKVSHGYDDMIGITLNDDVSHLLTEEAALLLVPNLQLDTMRRLIEKETLAFDYRGTEKVGKGPIIVCVDESGSMTSQDNIYKAKAFALAMAWVARHQRRPCWLLNFSSGQSYTQVILPPSNWAANEVSLLDYLEHFYCGGTDYNVPFDILPRYIWPAFAKLHGKGKTDLILVSDGCISIPRGIEVQFNAWKKESKCRAIGLMLGGYGAYGMENVLDEVHNVSTIDPDGEGVSQCFSV